MKNLFKKIYLNLISFFRIDNEDILIVSFPKVGSTWVRYFLFLIFSREVKVRDNSIDCMNIHMPEFGNSSILNQWIFVNYNKLIKTHKRFNLFFKPNRVIYLIRDPRDTMVSFYKYLSNSKNYGFSGTFSDVLRHKKFGLESYFKHYMSWEKRIDLLIMYEQLKLNPHSYFKKILGLWELELTDSEIEKYILKSNFNNMNKAQSQSESLKKEFPNDYNFIRTSARKPWQNYFSDEDIAYYNKLRLKYNFCLYE